MSQSGSVGQADDYPRAVALMMLCAVFLPLLNACVKYLWQTYPVAQLLWARYAGHLLFMLAVFAPRHGRGLLRSSQPFLQLTRSTLFCVSSFIMFFALGLVPLATAVAINFTSPLIVTALAPLVLKERVGTVRALAVAAGFLGALVVVRPGSGTYHWAAFLLFGSAATSAATQLMSRKLAGQDSPETSNTYVVLAGFVLTTLPLPFVWVTPASAWDAFLFCCLGVLGGVGHYCMVRAYEIAPAAFVSPFNYAQILGAAVLSMLVFSQMPDLWTWVGSAIIASSGLFILFYERARARARAGS